MVLELEFEIFEACLFQFSYISDLNDQSIFFSVYHSIVDVLQAEVISMPINKRDLLVPSS